MAISIDSLREGQSYIFDDRDLRIIKLFDFDGQLHVLYEYLFEGKYTKLDQCSAREFSENALRDYRNDPEFAEIYPYVFVVDVGDPDAVAAILNKPVKVNKEVKALKYFIKDLVNAGYRPAYFKHKKGLYLKQNFLPMERITEAGMKFAMYLSGLSGWDGTLVSLPDFYLPS